jgi:hypothetical protein
MEKAFEESEVFEVVKALNGDKVPSPSCFSMAFFQFCWEVLKEDIMNVNHDFNARDKFERSLNFTFYFFPPLFPRKLRQWILMISEPLVLWVACVKSSLKS